MSLSTTESSKIVSRAEWLLAQRELLAREKRLTRERDELARKRAGLPWVRVERDYVFEGVNGEETLGDLFDGRTQLIVSHFMFGPDWEEGCVGCSFRSDHVNGCLAHLENHDVSFVTISRAPLPQIEAFRKRMGWNFRWLSSCGSDFNYDFNVSFAPEEIAAGTVYYNYEARDFLSEELSGISVFYKNKAGQVFHTYSTYGRGDELLVTTYMYLDLTPNGRDETGPNYNLTDWVRHHDRYNADGLVDHTGRYLPATETSASCGCGKERPA